MGEPIDVFKRLLQENYLITYPVIKPFDESKPKAAWYRENDYNDYHKIKGHSTNKCQGLKGYIQGLIDQGGILVDANQATSSNAQLKIYQNAFPKHNQGPCTLNSNMKSSNNN